MHAINDALAHAIIRSTLDPNPAVRAHYQPTLHPSAPRTRLDLVIDTRAAIAATRRLVTTITAMITPAPAQPTCCATA